MRWKAVSLLLVVALGGIALWLAQTRRETAKKPEYRFVLDTSPKVAILRGGRILTGRWDYTGMFRRDRSAPVLEPGDETSNLRIINLPAYEGEPVYEYRAGMVPREGELPLWNEDGKPVRGDESIVLELEDEDGDRNQMSKRGIKRQVLIKGRLRSDGHFVPETGSVIIPFSDYRYSETAPRIYNLPGRFERVGGLEGE